MRKRVNNYVKLSRKIDGKELPVTQEQENLPVFKVGDLVRVMSYTNTATSDLGWPTDRVDYYDHVEQVHNWRGTIGYMLGDSGYWYVAEDLEFVT